MERLDVINKRLAEHYGADTITGLPIWRIVWSEDQLEKRLMDVTDAGIHLLTPEMREVPKYRHYIRNRWILERLVIVPEMQQKEIGTAISYEPMHNFTDAKGGFLPYKWEAAKFVIDTVYAAMGHQSMFPKYVDPDAGGNEKQNREERLQKLQEELFGNETSTGDALAHNQGVGYTGGESAKLIHKGK